MSVADATINSPGDWEFVIWKNIAMGVDIFEIINIKYKKKLFYLSKDFSISKFLDAFKSSSANTTTVAK